MSHKESMLLCPVVDSNLLSYALTRLDEVDTPVGRGWLDNRPILPLSANFPKVLLLDSLLATTEINLCLDLIVSGLANTPFPRYAMS